MSTLALDPPGPRGQRRIRFVSVLSLCVLVGVAWLIWFRFGEAGELNPAKWARLTERPVLSYLAIGLRNTLLAGLCAISLALPLGILVGVSRLSPLSGVRLSATAYSEFFRALPTLMLILFAFFVLPRVGVATSTFSALLAGIVVYNSAVISHIVRAGITSLPANQAEAARSLGLSRFQELRLVVLPQALRKMAPAIMNQLVVTFKDTSLGYVIGFEELLRRGQILGEFEGNLLQAYLAVAVIYVSIVTILSQVGQKFARGFRRR